MALVIADRCQEQTSTTGTGTVNLNGAATQYRTFVSGVGTGNQTYYCILSGNGTDWECGIGTVTTGSPDTLSRTTILSSSNSGSAITLSGTSTVFGNAPAALLGDAGLYGPSLNRPVPTTTGTGLSTTMGSGAAVTDTRAGILLTGSSGAGVRTSSVPSTPYTITALLSCTQPQGVAGFGWTDGTKIHFQYTPGVGIGNEGHLFVQRNSSITAFVSTDYNVVWGLYGSLIWQRIKDDGTNVFFYVSSDGTNYFQTYTVAKASGYLGGSGYTSIFVGAPGGSGAQDVTVLSYQVT